MHWSKTRHVAFAKCPRSFFYEAVAAPHNEKLASLAHRQGPPISRQSAVRDVVLALAQSRPSSVDPAALVAAARAALSKGIPNEADLLAQMTIVEQCISSFVSGEFPDLQQAEVVYISSGTPIEFVYDGLTIMAAPEVVVDRGSGVELLIYRTGASAWRDDDESRLRAGGLTCWARVALKCVDRPIVVTEVYLREGCSRFETALSDEDLREFVAHAKATLAQFSVSARIRDFPARPEVQGCRFCSFKEVCPEWQDYAESDFGLSALREAVLGAGNGSPAAADNLKDVFLCHASEDKDAVVRPLSRRLEAAGVSYWVDEAEILLGDSVVKGVNEGMRTSRFVLCFFSPSFVDRGWPEGEMAAALNAELSGGGPRVLPVIIGDPKLILDAYPLIRGKRYAMWSDGPDALVREIERVVARARNSRR